MTSKEINKRLTSDGWVLVGGRGNREKFKHATNPGHVVAPHPRKDIAMGTLRNIYRQAGWLELEGVNSDAPPRLCSPG